MKKSIFFILFFCLANISFSQHCINSTLNTSTVATPNSGFVEEITTLQFTDEYVVITGLIVGHDYRFTITHEDGGTIND